MIDREKVIKGLERCSKHDGSECPQCPYFNGECTDDLMADALSLLKEQSELLRKLQKDKDKLCLEVSEWKHKYHDRPLKEQETEWCERCGRVRLKSKWEGEEVNG